MKRIVCTLLILLLLPWSCLGEDTLSARDVFLLLEADETGQVYALFGDAMRSVMSEADLAAVLPSLEAAVGALQQMGMEETTVSDPYVICALPLQYERQNLLFQVSWEKGRIAGMYFSILPGDAFLPASEPLPDGIVEEEITVGDPPLSGLLTLPSHFVSPLPAVVLLHGSGPSDRDESVGGVKLFRDLAWGLAQHGIAVLRYDKRTLAYGNDYTPDEIRSMTVREEAMDDAALAARLLSADPRIDPSRVYLIGHSLGASIAPRIASEHPGLFAGLVLLSGTPVTLAEVAIHQQLAVSDGEGLEAALTEQWENVLSSPAEEAIGLSLFGVPAYYFWDLGHYDIGETLAGLSLPVLIINGGSDFQVTDRDGIDAWRALTLPDTVTLIHHPELNHFLMAPGAPKDVSGTALEYEIPCHAPQKIIEEISAFILQ